MMVTGTTTLTVTAAKLVSIAVTPATTTLRSTSPPASRGRRATRVPRSCRPRRVPRGSSPGSPPVWPRSQPP
jgi:hypothetical protein